MNDDDETFADFFVKRLRKECTFWGRGLKERNGIWYVHFDDGSYADFTAPKAHEGPLDE